MPIVPLMGPPPAEVHLPYAPLARVIAQVRFPEILSIRNPDKVAAFQEELRAAYPILSQDQVANLVLGTQGPATPRVEESKIWRFAENAVDLSWRVSLGTNYVALETGAYRSRTDFLERLALVLRAVERHFRPAQSQRLGIRHINRLTGEAVQEIRQLIKPHALGILVDADELGGAVLHLLSEAQLLTEEGKLMVRWGILPPNGTYDPESLAPLAEPSWIMDFDMFDETSRAFNSSELLTSATRFAERGYCVFRKMVTDEFLRFFGGKI